MSILTRAPLRRIPYTVRQRWARIEQLLDLVPPRDLPLDVWAALSHARAIVVLTPREFADCALASAAVLHMAERRAVAR